MKFQSDIIKKYLNGNFSLNDKTVVDEYITNQKYNEELNELLIDHWNELEMKKVNNEKNLAPLLDKINHQILLLSIKQTNTLKTLWRLYAKVAAVLLVPIIVASFYFYQKQNNNLSNLWVEVHSPYGARTQFSLPDGSTGWLNSGSVIRYPSHFKSTRNVTLNGEAFFDVVKNPNSPFIIDTKSIGIKVLGTSFNVVSYDVDSIAEVVVASGKVEVSANNKRFTKNLLPNERLVFNGTKNSFEKSAVDVQNYTSWKSGKLIFLNDNLDEVIRKISRYYNVNFSVDNNVNRGQLFRAIMEEESLEEVLRYMKLTMDIDYVVMERKLDQKGVITRREVSIKKAIKK